MRQGYPRHTGRDEQRRSDLKCKEKKKLFSSARLSRPVRNKSVLSHKQPHIKDERCIPKLCRYGPRDVEVDCVLADPVNPHVPKAKIGVPLKPEPVEEKKRAGQLADAGIEMTPETMEEKPEPAQRPVTLRKKPGRKAAK